MGESRLQGRASVANAARGEVMGTGLIRVGVGSISAGITVLAIGFAVKWVGMPADAGSEVERASLSVFGTNHPDRFDARYAVGSQIPGGPDVRLASLKTEVDTAPVEAMQPDAPTSRTPPSFDERFSAVGMGSISAGIAVLAVGFAVNWEGALAEAGLHVERASLSVFDTNHSENFNLRHPIGLHIPARPDVRLASLGDAGPVEAMQPDAPTSPPSFDERFSAFFDRQPGEKHDSVVFGAPVVPMPLTRGLQAPPLGTSALPNRMHAVRVLPPDSAKQETARPAGSHAGAAAVAQPSPPAASQKPVRTADLGDDSVSPPGPGNRTAIYDISAKVVYLPNGDKLEAHSGLGSNLDDPHTISVKHRGVTPPNVYDLALRKELFHGVQAIRLIPADEGKMFGRNGMLAHSYMLGSNGQSNGCVSFSNYPAFLDAFLKGEVDRLVVVEHFDGAPSPGTGLGWLPEYIRNLFKALTTAGSPSSST